MQLTLTTSILVLLMVLVAYPKEKCLDGVIYIQTLGMTVKYKADGKIATCSEKKKETKPQQ